MGFQNTIVVIFIYVTFNRSNTLVYFYYLILKKHILNYK